MIPRYDSPEISKLWTEEKKFEYFLKVELKLLEVLEEVEEYKIPQGLSQTISNKAHINLNRIHEIENQVHHDVIAFCTSITEQLKTEEGKYFHFGVTSSDIIDTALNLQIKDSLFLIISQLKNFQASLLKLVERSENVLCLGRSHGMQAEAMLLAQKWLSFYAEFNRRYEELEAFFKNDLTGQMSGAVGNYTILTPAVEQKVVEGLGLKVESVSSQIIPRDRLAKLISLGSLLASSLERLAVEIRHLSRSEVMEVSEGFSKGQKGSSTMPHKKNPVSSENISGLARVLRSHLSIAHENVISWHERDISHSSAERIYLPDHLGLLFYALKRMGKVLDDLVIHEETMKKRVVDNANSLSSFYLHELISKTKLSREEIYTLVQEVSFKGHQTALEFKSNLESKTKTPLSSFNYEDMLKHYQKHFRDVKNRVLTRTQ